MTIIHLTLAAILVLVLGPWTHAGLAVAAPIFPIVAFNDFFGESKPTGYLLGASSGRRWLKPRAAAGLIRGQEQYRLYTLAGEAGNSAGGKPTKGEEGPCTDTLYVTLAPYPAGRGSLVAVAGAWNAMPRKPKVANPEAQAYKEAAAAILRSKGIANPKVNLTQVLQVDLDGDGVEEVLVCASNYARFPQGGLTPDARAGDYSVVFLRQVVQGQVVTKIIAGEFYPQAKKFNAPSEYRIIGVLDLNGDGVLEIVLSGRYYEGDWTEAYRIEGAKITKLFNMGCGA